MPYEIATNDEKFLQEATRLIDTKLSELDICHHRVILKLRNACNDLNAEQLGKLAVMLLNCQSSTEGRILFECTDDMPLKDCTSNMDGETWNAYHLITNRAKAVCVATRHDQFRGLTELTVNKLMISGERLFDARRGKYMWTFEQICVDFPHFLKNLGSFSINYATYSLTSSIFAFA